MANFPRVVAPRNLERFLNEIGSLETPEKVTVDWLTSAGYTSSNDRAIPGVLEFIGFLDESRVPTPVWNQFRDKDKSGKVLAGAIRKGYSDLYGVRSDAHERDNEELKNFFKVKTGAGETVASRMVSAFKTLCSLADFSQMHDEKAISEDVPAEEHDAERPQSMQAPLPARKQLPSLHIDVQIHIASDADSEQIDQIFASMAKHLYNNN